MGWLIALAVVAGIAILPVGIRGVYREKVAGAWLLIGPLRFRLYPAKPKEKITSAQPEKRPASSTQKGGKLQDFLPIARTVLDFLQH